jgi:hypothetical protein
VAVGALAKFVQAFAQEVSRTRAFRVGATQIGGDSPPYFPMARASIVFMKYK